MTGHLCLLLLLQCLDFAQLTLLLLPHTLVGLCCFNCLLSTCWWARHPVYSPNTCRAASRLCRVRSVPLILAPSLRFSASMASMSD